VTATFYARTPPWQHLDALLLDEYQRLRVLPASEYARIPRDELRTWCHFRAVYQLPSQELVDWMRERIGSRSALEVGAGRGWLGRALGVRMTDNHCQSWADVRAYYEAMQQPTIPYGSDVEAVDALDAVARYTPQVVFGCWVTQKSSQPGGGSVYGLEEAAMLQRVEEYIVVGNDRIHGTKDIMARPHETVRAPWIISRAQQPELNAIYVWRGV